MRVLLVQLQRALRLPLPAPTGHLQHGNSPARSHSTTPCSIYGPSCTGPIDVRRSRSGCKKAIDQLPPVHEPPLQAKNPQGRSNGSSGPCNFNSKSNHIVATAAHSPNRQLLAASRLRQRPPTGVCPPTRPHRRSLIAPTWFPQGRSFKLRGTSLLAMCLSLPATSSSTNVHLSWCKHSQLWPRSRAMQNPARGTRLTRPSTSSRGAAFAFPRPSC